MSRLRISAVAVAASVLVLAVVACGTSKPSPAPPKATHGTAAATASMAGIAAVSNGPPVVTARPVANTPPPSTATPIPPTETPVPPTATPVPPVPTATPPPTAALPAQAAGVVSCAPLSPETFQLINPTPGPTPPSSIALPQGVTSVSGISVFAGDPRVIGAPSPGSPLGSFGYMLGPSGATCKQAYASADGGYFINLSEAGEGELVAVFSPGGLGPELTLSCPYIPAAAAAAVNGHFQCSPASFEDTVTQLPAIGGESVAIVLVPPFVQDPNISGSGGADTAIGLFTFGQLGGAQAIVCALPDGQRSVCIASLQYFLASPFPSGNYGLAEALQAIAKDLALDSSAD